MSYLTKQAITPFNIYIFHPHIQIREQKFTEAKNMKKTIVLYPTPDMGHIISMVELGKLILHHYTNKFSIIILQTTGFRDGPQLHSYIQLISQSYPSITFHRFPFQYVDTSPTRSPAAICFEFIRLNAPNVHQALQELLKSHTICAFIIDLFCTSALSLGKDLKIPTYYFFTSGSTVLGSFLYFPILHKRVTKSFKDLKNEIIQFPGMPPLKATELPEPMPDRDDPAYWDMLYFCLNLPKSDGIIVNTFNGLEPSAVKAITDGVCVPDSKTPPMFTIGPLIKEEEEEEEKGSNEDCLSWLDQQPKQSVVYLCFGSRGSLSTLQVKEIANGLEKSGQRFLWVVKKPPSVEKMKQIENLVDFDLESILPYGFLERTKELGKVVKCWVPQVAVLKKESIGGFVTHCGWNSVLESVVAGVPMIAWPLYAEQHMNRNFLVNGLKLAIAVEQREGDEFVSGAELEKRVNELIGSKSGSEIREKSWKMKEMALVAWGVCGSSSVSLAEFVEAICK